MKVSDILAHIRARLRDDNAEFTRTGDSFLINQIRFWQNQLLAEFNQNIAEFTYTIPADLPKSEVEISFEPLKILAVFLNGVRLRVVSYEMAIRLLQSGENNGIFYQKRGQVFGFESEKVGDLQVFGVKKAVIDDADDELVLDDSFENLLVFCVYLDILKTNTTPSNLEQINAFSVLVEQEKQLMRANFNRLNGETSFKTKCVRV